MPYPVKIQPIDVNAAHEPTHKFEPVGKPVLFKSRFKRLIERQFSSVLRTSASDNKLAGASELLQKDAVEEFEPSSVCLAKMVQNFIEESNDKQKCGKNRCNCFNGNSTDSSDEESESYSSSSTDACDVLKSLVPCLCISERNLLADTAKIVERNRISKRKDEFCRKIVADGLVALGYDASICRSEWEKSPSHPAGKYEYVDVIISGERLIIDIDFRSEFEIARSTKAYKLVLQTLPNIFVGKPERLEGIIGIVSEAAKQSLKKKGMPIPPWRKAEYVKAKWLSPFTRICQQIKPPNNKKEVSEKHETSSAKSCSPVEVFDLLYREKASPVEKLDDGVSVFVLSNSNNNNSSPTGKTGGLMEGEWQPPEIRPRSLIKGVKIVTGLASVMEDKS